MFTLCSNLQSCASACLQEDDVKMMARCIELDMQCAAICYTAAQLMSLGNDKASEVCRMCADICELCGAEMLKVRAGNAPKLAVNVPKSAKNEVKKFTELLPFVLPEKFIFRIDDPQQRIGIMISFFVVRTKHRNLRIVKPSTVHYNSAGTKE
jgi:hypothetical protein